MSPDPILMEHSDPSSTNTRWGSTATRRRVTILVCFDSPVLQAGMMAMLARERDFDCAEDVGAPFSHGNSVTPDVIVADRDRAIGWANAAVSIHGTRARPRVLVVTHSDRECDIRASLSCGVHGYLLVDDVPEHLASAIRATQPGRILSPRVASRLAENVALESLTQREEAVLGLVVEGLCNKSIANRLGITAGTVKSHLRSAFSKIGATSRTQAVAVVQRRGLLQPHKENLRHDQATSRSAHQPLFKHHEPRPLPALAAIGS